MAARKKAQGPAKRLEDLVSVGPATLKDFEVLGISTLEQLATCEARDLYERLCVLTKARHDPCAEDVFSCAIAQARDPDLPKEQKNWFWWSRLRRANHS